MHLDTTKAGSTFVHQTANQDDIGIPSKKQNQGHKTIKHRTFRGRGLWGLEVLGNLGLEAPIFEYKLVDFPELVSFAWPELMIGLNVWHAQTCSRQNCQDLMAFLTGGAATFVSRFSVLRFNLLYLRGSVYNI